jgi:ATP-binding protein involved in chromosome partitioning
MILGIKDVQPKEDKGIIPPNVHGLEHMSIVYYSGDFATPLRGTDASNVLVELLSITKWSKLDFLILDMPPGISDTTLDLLRLVKRVKFIIVTTSSVLAFETVKKLASLLKDLQKPVLGVIENMKRDKSDTIEKEAGKLGFRYLGSIPYDEKLEEAIGYLSQIEKTDAARSIAAITLRI